MRLQNEPTWCEIGVRHMFWVLKRKVSWGLFFRVPTTYFWLRIKKDIFFILHSNLGGGGGGGG